MVQFSNSIETAVANCSEAIFSSAKPMESGDHFKNGASSKSQMSRGNFLRKACFVLLAACVIFSGCSNESDNDGKDDNNGSEDVYLLMEMTERDGLGQVYEYDRSIKFEYDEQNRITKITTSYGDEVHEVRTLGYNEVGDLISLNWEWCNDSYPDFPHTTRTFSQNDKVVTITYPTLVDDETDLRMSMVLNDQGLPEKYSSYQSIYEVDDSYSIFIYQYQDGNLSSRTYVDKAYYNDDPGSQTMTYTYDNKKGPFYHCKTPKWVLIWSFDNMIGIQNNIKGGSFTFEYMYNEDGFPLTQKTILNDSRYSPYITTYKYEKK